jgi:signal transduction histidine kinase
MARDKEPDRHLEFTYRGKKYDVLANNNQITDLLLSIYGTAIEKNHELEQTNRKLGKLHLELQEKTNELAKLNEQKNLMLGMAAHDLRNPLSAIQLYSEILQEKINSNDQKVEKMIQKIASSSQYMLHLVNDLLDLSVIDAGQMQLKLEKMDLSTLVKRSCELNDALAESKKIALTCDVQDFTPQVHCDTNKIEQVLHNLISNGVKYSKEGSSIRVGLKVDQNQAVVSVKDNGKGIPKGDQNNLFKMFGRTSVKSTAGEPSTGLGLAIAKKIVEGHGGKIWFESQEGLGSTFFFSLNVQG